MFAEDRGWVRRIEAVIQSRPYRRGGGSTGAQRYRRPPGAGPPTRIWRERITDFDDLATRLLLILSGRGSQAAVGTLPDDVVLVARSIGPAELLDYEQKRLRAVVAEEGSATSHVAIVARGLGHPHGRALYRRPQRDRPSGCRFGRWRQQPDLHPAVGGCAGRV